jgi:hypothetical protein
VISIEREGFRPTRIPLHACNTSVVFIWLHRKRIGRDEGRFEIPASH